MKKASLRTALPCGREQSQHMAEQLSQTPDHSVPKLTLPLPCPYVRCFCCSRQVFRDLHPFPALTTCVCPPPFGDLARHLPGLRFLLPGAPWFFSFQIPAAQPTLFPGNNSVPFLSPRWPTLPFESLWLSYRCRFKWSVINLAFLETV